MGFPRKLLLQIAMVSAAVVFVVFGMLYAYLHRTIEIPEGALDPPKGADPEVYRTEPRPPLKSERRKRLLAEIDGKKPDSRRRLEELLKVEESEGRPNALVHYTLAGLRAPKDERTTVSLQYVAGGFVGDPPGSFAAPRCNARQKSAQRCSIAPSGRIRLTLGEDSRAEVCSTDFNNQYTCPNRLAPRNILARTEDEATRRFCAS